MKKRCLGIKLEDGRVFFTEKKNYKMLLEFGKLTNSELFFAITENPHLFGLEQLAAYISDKTIVPKKQDYEKCKKTFAKKENINFYKTKFKVRKENKKISEKTKELRNYIKELFEKKQVVCIENVMQFFSDKYEIKQNDVYSSIRFLKEYFKTKGKIVKRVSQGKYTML